MVDTECFQNDLAEIHSKDDALTALIHLGYLGYDADILSAYIPNYEVAKAFQSALKTGEWKDVAASISKCDTLLMATISGNTEKVAELIELAHDTYTSILKYNDENSLSCVLTMAYFTRTHKNLPFCYQWFLELYKKILQYHLSKYPDSHTQLPHLPYFSVQATTPV